MIECESQLRLKQADVTLCISAQAWRQLLAVAYDKGWKPDHPPACYWGDIGLVVSAPDARRLARVFEVMGDFLVDHPSDRLPAEADELIENLGELVIFCRSGGFRVC